jgi:hypothetical protein
MENLIRLKYYAYVYFGNIFQGGELYLDTLPFAFAILLDTEIISQFKSFHV